MARTVSRSPFLFRGGDLALDFANTRLSGEDLLSGPGRLEAWRRAAGLGKGGGRGGRGGARLRDAVRQAAEALAAGHAAPGPAVAEIDRVLAAHRGALRLRRTRGGLRFGFDPLGGVLVAVAEAAARLLAGPDAALVRRCANPACVLLFLDRTRNRARRWCSMEGCGNRMKVAAWRARNRRTGGHSRGGTPSGLQSRAR